MIQYTNLGVLEVNIKQVDLVYSVKTIFLTSVDFPVFNTR